MEKSNSVSFYTRTRVLRESESLSTPQSNNYTCTNYFRFYNTVNIFFFPSFSPNRQTFKLLSTTTVFIIDRTYQTTYRGFRPKSIFISHPTMYRFSLISSPLYLFISKITYNLIKKKNDPRFNFYCTVFIVRNLILL